MFPWDSIREQLFLFFQPEFRADWRSKIVAVASLPAITERRTEPKESQTNESGLSLDDDNSELAVTESINVFKLYAVTCHQMLPR